ncbi:MAG: hypothetical protein K6E31_09115 [bacterium]|nr:hypothetical protein [Deltaproteobacteria bacterium]MCR5221131.1 hypothetical protein [bacterium]
MNRTIFLGGIFLLLALLPAAVFADVVFLPEELLRIERGRMLVRNNRQIYAHVAEDGRLELVFLIGGMHGTCEYTLRSLAGDGEEGPLVASGRYENDVPSVPLERPETVKLPELGENGTARYRFEAVCRPKFEMTGLGLKETAREERAARDFILCRQNGVYSVAH